MTYAGWHIEQLRFTGNSSQQTALSFGSGLSLIYGASNTGKSFALKALDFMFGGQRELPNISERGPYDKLWLDIAFSPDHITSLERAIAGGAFRVHERGQESWALASKHNPKNPLNISTFLLNKMDATDRKVSVDIAGTHGNLTFRDIASLVLTDETSIQSENSPIESGDRMTQQRERNVLKFILTGNDDSAIVPIIKATDFRTGRTAKVALIQDMIEQINSDLEAGYPDIEGLAEQADKIEETLSKIEQEYSAVQGSVQTLLDDKRRLIHSISVAERRCLEITLSLDSFEQLEKVYTSDIARLESLEEVGFLLELGGKGDCTICGAPPEAHKYTHVSFEIEDVRIAAEVEIQKIKQQRNELLKTVADTKAEYTILTAKGSRLRDDLALVEKKLKELTPNLNNHQRKLTDILSVRDHVKKGLELISQRDQLTLRRESIASSKPPKADERIQRGLSTETAKEFADVVSDVLLTWGFPGQKQVIFDLSTYDLIIDGKERRNNGKGVRAITHAAFKVALMIFCRERNLPHPGFLILDTPLLTYRDPMKKVNDRLELDEQEIRNTDLKERFFDHLSHLGERSQIVIFENIDPPQSLNAESKVEVFTNDPSEGRQGLL